MDEKVIPGQSSVPGIEHDQPRMEQVRLFQEGGTATCGQDGGVGKHTSPPHTTTKKELPLNLQTTNTQNSEKIKLYEKSNNKGFKEATGRKGGDVETGQRSKKMQCGAKRQQQWWNGHGWSHLHVW